MKASPAQQLDIIDSVARGISIQDALRKSGLFSKTTVESMGLKTFGSKAFRRSMREWGEALSEKIEDLAAAELETLRVGKAPTAECVAALRGIWAAYNQRASRKELRLTGGQAITKQAFAERWTPEAQQKLAETRERAKLLQPGDFQALSDVQLAEDLLSPPKEARVKVATLRLGYERAGLLGTNPNVLHLHQTNQEFNFNAVPAELQKKFFARMINIAARENPESSAEE